MAISSKLVKIEKTPLSFKEVTKNNFPSGKPLDGYQLAKEDEFIREIACLQEAVLKRTNAREDSKTLQPFLASTEQFYQKFLGLYNKFIENNRLDPTNALIMHPKNTRVLSAISQNEFSPGADRKTNVSLVTSFFSKALDTTSTLDEAVNLTDKTIKLWGSSDGLFPRIQKPVSTPKENALAWKKSDNLNGNVKRIVISFKHPGTSFNEEQAEIQKCFIKESAFKFKNFSREEQNKYRVDEIIEIEASNPEKIEEGFRKAHKFVQNEREKARLSAIESAKKSGKNDFEQKKAGTDAVNALIFEGFAGWYGHGTTLKEKDPLGDAVFLEGSREFCFTSADISETRIKRLENQYLNEDNFRYFVHYYDGCKSGAMIA